MQNEEVGLRVKNLHYFGSQAWPFPHSLMLGFFAEYDSGELVLQEEEIEDAKWFTKDNLPQLPKLATISGIMINHWLKNR
jgi:NAD+ diphosphatase